MARKVMVYSLDDGVRGKAASRVTELESDGWSLVSLEPTSAGNVIITMERHQCTYCKEIATHTHNNQPLCDYPGCTALSDAERDWVPQERG